jgi:hypothetical protein
MFDTLLTRIQLRKNMAVRTQFELGLSGQVRCYFCSSGCVCRTEIMYWLVAFNRIQERERECLQPHGSVALFPLWDR